MQLIQVGAMVKRNEFIGLVAGAFNGVYFDVATIRFINAQIELPRIEL
jgi:hypothetical protein